MEIFKAWISINGRATGSAYNNSSRLDLEKGEIWLKFPDDVIEAEAIALGKRFEVLKNVQTFANLEGRANSRLRDINGISGYEISLDTESLRRAIAWYEEGEGVEPVTHPVRLVEKTITFDDEVYITNNWVLLTSSNLTGKLIKIRWPVVYDEQIVRTPELLDSFMAHVVFSEDGKVIKIMEVRCTPVVSEFRGKNDKIRSVHGKFIEDPRITSI